MSGTVVRTVPVAPGPCAGLHLLPIQMTTSGVLGGKSLYSGGSQLPVWTVKGENRESKMLNEPTRVNGQWADSNHARRHYRPRAQ
jgi:hypothetical protein